MPRRVSDRDRGVTPVIGIILIVAIAVILATVVGVFALNFGDQGSQPMPNVRFDATYNDDVSAPNGEYLNVTVQGGERVPTDRLEFAVDGATDGSGPATLTGDPVDQAGDELITRDVISIDATAFDTDPVELSDATVTLVWDPDPDSAEQGQTQRLWHWQAD